MFFVLTKNTMCANIANVLSGKQYCRMVLSVRSSLQQSAKLPEYKYLVNPLVKLLYNNADKIMGVSKVVERIIRDFSFGKYLFRRICP